MKKILIGTIVVFVAISLMDFLIHSVFLSGIYGETQELWRTEAEMMSKMWVMYLASIIGSFCFAFIYGKLISPKSTKNSVLYGLFWGIAAGASMGYGTYSVMPLPYVLAASWFWASVVELTISGYLLGLIIKE